MIENSRQPMVRQAEMVSYRLEDMAYTTASLIKNVAVYSGIEGTQNWFASLMDMVEKIRTENPNSSTLNSKGLNLTFSGIPHALVPIISEDKVIFSQREPRFIFKPLTFTVPKSQWEHIEQITDQVSQEMAEVYKMKRDGKYNLIFPKNEYGTTTLENIIVFN